MINVIGFILSILAFAITVFSWIGLSPGTFGQLIYDRLFILFPILSFIFGFFAAWNIRGWWFNRQKGKQFSSLTPEEAEQLLEIYDSGVYDAPNDDKVCSTLEVVGAIEKDSNNLIKHMTVKSWRVTKQWRDHLDKHQRKYKKLASKTTKAKIDKSIKKKGYAKTFEEIDKNIEWNDDGTMKR